MKTKICSRCKKRKSLGGFCKYKAAKDGLRYYCKECMKEYNKKYCKKYYKTNSEEIKEQKKENYKNNKEKIKEYQKKYYKTNAGHIKEKSKEHYKANSEEIKEKGKERYKTNIEKYREYNKEYYKNNPEYMKEYVKQWRRNNPQKPKGMLNHRMSAGIYGSLKANKAGRHWESLVPYTLRDLVDRLESLFLPGMSWLNMGKWHIDHIIPKAYFDYSTAEDLQFKKCWALDNLQPLWKEDNLKKGKKLNYKLEK